MNVINVKIMIKSIKRDKTNKRNKTENRDKRNTRDKCNSRDKFGGGFFGGSGELT